MKKYITRLAAFAMVMALSLAFVACNDDPGTQTKESYTVTCTYGEYYDISADHMVAEAGTLVTVTAESEVFMEIDTVYVNGIACSAGSEAGKFTFTMPEEDVTVTADVSGKEILSAEDGMYWSKAPTVISVFDESELSLYQYQDYGVSFGTDPVNASINTSNEMMYAEVVSLNEEVIPAEAISGVRGNTQTSVNPAFYNGTFEIDRTKIKTGTATLVFFDTDNDRVLSKTITVVPFGDVHKGETEEVSVTVDFTGLSEEYRDENFSVFFYEDEETYVYGSVYPKTQREDLTYPESGTVTYTFLYVPGLNFTLRVGYETVNEFDITIYPSLPIEGDDDGEIVPDFSESNSITIKVGNPVTD